MKLNLFPCKQRQRTRHKSCTRWLEAWSPPRCNRWWRDKRRWSGLAKRSCVKSCDMSCLVCCVGTSLTAASSCAGNCRTSLASLGGRRASLGWHLISTGWVLTSHTDHRNMTTVPERFLLNRIQNVFYVIETSHVLCAKLCTTASTPQYQWFHFAERILYNTIVCIYN